MNMNVIKAVVAVALLSVGAVLLVRTFQPEAHADTLERQVAYLCVNDGCGEGFSKTLREVRQEAAANPGKATPLCPQCNSGRVVVAYQCPECEAFVTRIGHGAIPDFCSECKAPLSRRIDPNDPDCSDPVILDDAHAPAEQPIG